MRLHAWYSDHLGFPLPEGHRFPLAKYAQFRAELLQRGVLAAHEISPAPLATDAELAAAHDPSYLDAVIRGELDPRALRRIGLPWSPELVVRSRASVGGTLAAARHALEHGAGGNLAGGTHHAFADHGEGYCVFNDLAVTARVLLAEGRVRRVAIVDLDVHQGNGTAAIFAGDPVVCTLSLHGEKNFPFRKTGSTVDVALPDGTDDVGYLRELDAHLPSFLDAARPELLLYQAGVDPLREDALGRLSLSHGGLRARDARVFVEARTRNLPVVITMGGGYGRPIAATIAAHVGTWLAAREVLGI
jgi:acetoin utilization deacetylase AcuC-like enzyme